MVTARARIEALQRAFAVHDARSRAIGGTDSRKNVGTTAYGSRSSRVQSYLRPRAVRPTSANADTIASGVARWLDEHVSQRKPTTRKQYRDAGRVLVSVLGHLPLEHVQQADIVALLETVADGSRPAVFSAWSSCLRWLGLRHVVQGIPRPKSKVREAFFDGDDLRHWMKAIGIAYSEHWAHARTLDCLLALTLVPMRIGELVSLRWTHVDLGRRLATLPEHKTDRYVGARMVPLGTIGASVIARQPRDGAFVWTPPRASSLEHITATGVSHACKRVLRRYESRTGHRFHPKMCAHGLRHTWSTHAGACGESDETIRLICGWSTSWMKDRYSHQLADELGAATNRVQARLVAGMHLQLEIATS